MRDFEGIRQSLTPILLLILIFVMPVTVIAESVFPLTDVESGILLRYFSGAYNKMTTEDYLKFRSNVNSIFQKIQGEPVKKNINELKIYITLIYMADTYSESSQDNIIFKGLYERFKLQPNDYLQEIRRYKGKRDAFCYYLGVSFNDYLYDSRITNTKLNQRELFLSLHLNSMQSLGEEEYIGECLAKFYEKMPEL